MCFKNSMDEIELLYNKYGPMVIRRCCFLLKDEQVAVDISHEVFMKIIEKKEELDLSQPSSLLYRMATNLCLNYIRDHKKYDEDSSDILDTIAQYEDIEHETAIKSLLNKVFKNQTESTRTIAVMHLLDGFTLEETAKEVGLSVSGVRKRLRIFKESVQNLEVEYAQA
jgi:RNA polymerase sigma factor (sigma-70 family)